MHGQKERSSRNVTSDISSTDFELFPNPASTYFSLRSFGRKIENVKVVDYLGRTLMDINWKGKLTDPLVDINELAPGAYQVMINNGAAVLPLIKQ